MGDKAVVPAQPIMSGGNKSEDLLKRPMMLYSRTKKEKPNRTNFRKSLVGAGNMMQTWTGHPKTMGIGYGKKQGSTYLIVCAEIF